MAEEFKKMEKEILPVDVVTFVPMFPSKQKKRGYNQAELLAKELCKIIEINLDNKNLARIKDTSTQTELSFSERQKNLENAFKVENKQAFKGKVVLLVDDVLTTGATANNCAKELKRVGAKEVYVLTFATTELEKA